MSEPTLDALVTAFARVCFEGAPAPEDLALLAPDGHERAGLLVYREMIHLRARALVADVFPRTRAAVGLPALEAHVDAWLADAPPRSRFFRDLALGWSAWTEAHPLPGPAHVPDLVRLEAARWRASIAEDADPGAIAPFDLAHTPVPSPSLTLLDVAWAVHEDEGEPPRPGAYHLAVYRRPDLKVETRWMEPLGARLVAGWARGDLPAIDVVRRTLAEAERAPDAAFVDGMSELLSRLLEGGALLGSRPEAAS